MINMISLTGFDKSEMQKNSSADAETGAQSDEFSAFLAAFAPASTTAEIPVLLAVEIEKEIPECAPPSAAEQNFSETGEQIVKPEITSGQNVIQTVDAAKPFAAAQTDSNLTILNNDFKRNENLPVRQNQFQPNLLPETSDKTGVSETSFQYGEDEQSQTDFEYVEHGQNQADKISQETRSGEKQPAKPEFFVRSNEPIKPFQNVRNGNSHLKNSPSSKGENKAIVRQFSQENQTVISTGSQIEINADTEGKQNLQPQIQTGIVDFTPKKKFFFSLPQLFREVSAKLKFTEDKSAKPKITEIETKRFERPENIFEFTDDSQTPVERAANEIKRDLPKTDEPDVELRAKVEPISDLPTKAETIADLPNNKMLKQIENIEFIPAAKTKINTEVNKSSFEARSLKSDAGENKTNRKSMPENVVSQVFERFSSAIGKESKIASSQPAILIESEKIFEQIASRLNGEISVFARKTEDANILKMRLRPAELGVVEVKLEKSESGKIHLHLQTESDATQQILTADLGALRESLQNAGWQIERLEISSGLLSSAGSENRENPSRQAETVEKAFVQTGALDDDSENTDDSKFSHRLVNLRA